MQELIHHTVQTLEEHFGHFNKVQELYHEKSFDFDTQFDAFLQNIHRYFREKGNTTRESEVLKIMNMITTVKRGFDPVKLEKITGGKREMVSGFSFNGMENIHLCLNEIYNKEKKKLDDGEELLSGLAVSLYQNNILDNAKIKEMNSVAKIQVFWSYLLTQNETIAGIDKKLRLTLMSEDIYLIFERVLLKLA